MDSATVGVAVALGTIQGVTEFVPVSSTGHLILAGRWLSFPPEKAAAFEIFIQLGAVLAVLWFYRQRLGEIVQALPHEPRARSFVGKIALAFIPAALTGLLLHGWIVRTLFAPLPVAAALALGGALLIAIDRPGVHAGRTRVLEEVSWTQAFAIGCAQVTALWPGVSRSGATVIGGLLAGLDRTVALEYSFLLAIPTLGAAAIFALWQGRSSLGAADAPIFALGLVVSFAVSLLVIAALLRYVRGRDLRPFGWYRLVLAALVVLVATGSRP